MMRNTKLITRVAAAGAIAATVLAGAIFAQSRRDEDPYFSKQEQETVRKTFPLTAAHKSLEVDNVFGSIEVTGTDSNEVQLVLTRTNKADTQEKLDQAKKEVTLEINQQADSVTLYVNGPFRCGNYNGFGNCGGCGCCGGCGRDRDYFVRMDFQLRVPRNIDLVLKTVTSGQIHVENTSGQYSVHNVNGAIEMLNIAGSGAAKTVNGGVKVTFRESPRENSAFQTVNGGIELYFPRNLSADFRFKTMNGAVYTDFEMTSLPLRAVQEQREGTRVIYRADRSSGARVGSGGPEISAENLNGSIRILESHE